MAAAKKTAAEETPASDEPAEDAPSLSIGSIVIHHLTGDDVSAVNMQRIRSHKAIGVRTLDYQPVEIGDAVAAVVTKVTGETFNAHILLDSPDTLWVSGIPISSLSA